MKTIGSLLIVVLAMSPAVAADLPNRAAPPVYVAPLVPYAWTGCYVGGFGALDIAHVNNDPSDFTSNRVTTRTATTGAPTSTSAATSTASPTSVPFTRQSPINPNRTQRGFFNTTTTQTRTVTTNVVRTTTNVSTLAANVRNQRSYGRTLFGGDGGGRVGCNYQTGRFVLGAQLEGGYLGIGGTTFDPVRRSTASAIGGGVYGAVTGRVGYAVFDRTLVYARGGVGYADLRFATYDPVLGYNSSVRGSRVMPLVGAGIEYKLTPRVSLTGEYTYLRPGCRTLGYAFSIAAGGGGASTTCAEKHMIAVGLNYYFTPEAAPIVARY